MIPQKMKPFALALGIIGITIFLSRLPWENLVDQKPYAQEIKRANNPYLVVDRFLDALIKANINLAKELIIPEQRGRVDAWKAESNHKAHKCPYNWRWFDPWQTTAWGVGGEDELDANTSEIDITFGCSNDNFLMSIENAIVRYDGVEWAIINWEMICEIGSSKGEEEVCYH